jgi:4-amino-4-deoxy-L-arabinose transferase-like glycosyltransferase
MASSQTRPVSEQAVQPWAQVAQAPWILPTILAVLALAVRLWCFTGLIASDDVLYAHYARLLASGRYSVEANHMALRFGLLLPVAGAYALFGVSELTTVLVPLLASVASVILVFLIGRRQFGVKAGVIAALLMASFPLSIRYGSILVPEPVAGFYILTALWLYLSSRESGRLTTATAAGIFLGVAYLTRELALFVILAVLIEAAWQRRWRMFLAVAFGSLIVVIGEQLCFWFVSGDPLLRLHAMADHNQRPNAMAFLQHPAWRFFRAIPHMMLIPSLGFGLHSVMALALAALASFVLSVRQTALFILWIAVPLFYVNFGTTSLKTYIAMPVGDRYLELIYPPLFILSGALLATLLKKKETHAGMIISGVALLFVSGVLCGHATRAAGWRTADVVRLRQIARTIKSESGSIVRFDGPSNRAWSGAVDVLEPTLTAPTLRRGFVVEPDNAGLPVAIAQP